MKYSKREKNIHICVMQSQIKKYVNLIAKNVNVIGNIVST